jgi:hypothetical protein
MKWYLWHLESIVDFIEKFKKVVIDTEFTDHETKNSRSAPGVPLYCWTPRYQEYWTIIRDIVEMSDMLGIELLEERKHIMVDRTNSLNLPTCIPNRSAFETDIDYIKNQFKTVENEIKTKLRILDDEEKNRFNEALNCYFQGCNYSAVAMSVSAIESRLFSLMLSKCNNPKLEKLTLGQLITEYLENKSKYGNVIPKKHESLLEYCNVYRVFSVHPKREKITKSIATSIINMTFAFLFDENLKHKTQV